MSRPPVDPNLITLLRLPLAPVALAFLVVLDAPQGPAIALGLSLLLEATDALDGYVARRYQVVSDFGKLFDPFSDAFSRFTLFLGLYAVGAADLWMILVIFYRDSGISFFRSVAATRRQVMAARPTGKIKAIVQAIGVNAILLLLATLPLIEAPAWALEAPWWIMLVVTLVTGASFFDYLYGAWPVLRAAWAREPSE
ncbi:MAG: CDP-alcohol phosphatidyltransferase family protein [Deltaproteobacteria bacterium]|nr:MAG: CDP-alcohol phosphatidyltransferase family protein [Deltaproteobacteria bacterium]